MPSAFLSRFLLALAALMPIAGAQDPLKQLERWESQVTRQGLTPERVGELQPLLRALDARRAPELAAAAEEALLDLAVFGVDEPGPQDLRKGSSLATQVRRLAFRELRARTNGEGSEAFLDRLLSEVLIGRRTQPVMRRYAALDLLDHERTVAARVALLRLARDEEDPLRSTVLWTITRWPGEATDLFLVGLLSKKWPAGARPHPFNLILHRIRDEKQPLGQRAQLALEQRIAWMLIDTDWREASRGLELARGLDTEKRVPLLLDGLSAWNRREQRGMGSLRIATDIQRELRRISGRKINLDARNWITWWIAVRQGRIPLHAEEQGGSEQRSSASFFGLRPISDRVVFVLDASGSMEAGWGTTGHNRYVEAVNQMTSYLQAAGEDTYFNVVLFNSVSLVASTELIQATAENLERIRSNLLERHPEGNTLLRPAIEAALSARNGVVDPDEVEVDTIVVLCDGETASGPRWVVPFLDRIRAEVRVVFHCVLLATDGDGTLEALTRETGGELLRVAG